MRLVAEANVAGGHIEYILGNHDIHNLEGDFEGVHAWSLEISGGAIGRKHLLSVNTDLGAFLRTRKIFLQYQGWVFAHGGIMPATVTEAKRLLGKEYHPTTFMGKINTAVRRSLTGTHPPGNNNTDKSLANIVLNADYSTNQAVNPTLVRPIGNCEDVLSVVKELHPHVTALIVGHTSHDLPDYVYCAGKLFAVDFGSSRWKTGQKGSIACMQLVPRDGSEKAFVGLLAPEAQRYENKSTLGDWVAGLIYTKKDELPSVKRVFQMRTSEALFSYRILLIALVIIALFMIMLLASSCQIMGGGRRWAANPEEGGGGEGAPLKMNGHHGNHNGSGTTTSPGFTAVVPSASP
jgi:hypothetical protein